MEHPDPGPLPRRPEHVGGLVVRPLGDATFVADLTGPRVHVLNATAAVVLDRCDGTATTAELAAALAQEYGADPALVAADVEAAVADFARADLLVRADLEGGGAAGSESGARVDGARQEPCGCLEQAPGSTPAGARAEVGWPEGAPTTSWFDVAGRRLRYRSADLGLLAFLDDVLAPLVVSPATPPGDLDPLEVGLVTTADGAIVVMGPDQVVERRPATIATYLLWDLNRTAIERGAPGLRLHAAALARPDGGIVVVAAPPDAGKSTLALGLVRSGWSYLGDESLTVSPDDGRLVPFLKPLTLDHGSWPLFEDLRPGHDERWPELSLHRWHLDVRSVGGGVPADPYRFGVDDVVGVVVPGYEPGAATELVPIEPEGLAPALAANVFNLAEVGEAGVDLLVGLASSVPGVRLRSGDLAASVEAVRAHLG